MPCKFPFKWKQNNWTTNKDTLGVICQICAEEIHFLVKYAEVICYPWKVQLYHIAGTEIILVRFISNENVKWLRRLKKNKVISCNPEKRYLIRNVLHTNDSMNVIYGRKTKFSPLAALEIVETTTFGAAIDENVTMTISPQCYCNVNKLKWLLTWSISTFWRLHFKGNSWKNNFELYFYSNFIEACEVLGAVSIRKTVLPGMVIPMLKIRRPNGRLIFNMEIAIRR